MSCPHAGALEISDRVIQTFPVDSASEGAQLKGKPMQGTTYPASFDLLGCTSSPNARFRFNCGCPCRLPCVFTHCIGERRRARWNASHTVLGNGGVHVAEGRVAGVPHGANPHRGSRSTLRLFLQDNAFSEYTKQRPRQRAPFDVHVASVCSSAFTILTTRTVTFHEY